MNKELTGSGGQYKFSLHTFFFKKGWTLPPTYRKKVKSGQGTNFSSPHCYFVVRTKCFFQIFVEDSFANVAPQK